MSDEEFVTIGILGRTRGVRGEIWVRPETDFPDRFVGLKEVYLNVRDRWEKRTIAESHLVGGRPVMRFEGCETPDQASRLTNRELAVPRSEVVTPPDGHYFIFDLIGCRAVDGNGQTIGEIVDVARYPANDTYVIATSDGHRMQLPAVRQFVKRIAIEDKVIVIDPAGLLDAGETKPAR